MADHISVPCHAGYLTGISCMAGPANVSTSTPLSCIVAQYPAGQWIIPFSADLLCKSPVRQCMVEMFFKSLKAELIWRNRWETRRQAEGAIFQYINGFYNPRRRHSSLGGKSPLAFERKAA